MRFLLGLMSIVLLLASVTGTQALEEHLVLHLSFDEGAGKETKDRTDKGHVGVLVNGPKWIDGKFEKALSFEKGAKVEIKRSDVIELKKNITVATWVRLRNSVAKHEIVRKQLPNGKGYDIRIQNGPIYWWVNPGGWKNANHQKPLPANEWIHVAGTYDAKKLRLYIDGKEVASNDVVGDIGHDASDLLIGSAAPHDGSYNLDGDLDEFMIFSKVLIEAEILEIMETPHAVEPAGKLVTKWGAIKNRY